MNREIYAIGDGYVLYPLAEVDRDNYVQLQRQIEGERTLLLMPEVGDMLWDMKLNKENTSFTTI